MPFDFEDLVEALPYDSELLGVYEPLLGWRSRQATERVAAEGARLTREVIRNMANDLRIKRVVDKERSPVSPIDPLPTRTQWSGTEAGRRLDATVDRFVAENKRPPGLNDWPALVKEADLPGALQRDAVSSVPAPEILHTRSYTVAPRASLPEDVLSRGGWHQIEGTELLVSLSDERAVPHDTAREGVVAGTLKYLSDNHPALLANLVLQLPRQGWELAQHYIDPLADFDPEQRNAVLSPIGILHLFREYFFEGHSFAGPAVGHVWLSPGSTLELYEVHTRKSLEERRLQRELDSTAKSEKTTTDQDELSTAISEQNGRNTNLGVSASAGVNFGVVQSSTSANFALGETRQTSQQTARKHMRQQSEKTATEIRQSVQTSFRTSLETDDTESRRYVLNNTSDRLVNYELRRKMRRVGVQVQRLGAQLCWQVYVDEPGSDLGIAELVHVAQPSDLDGAQPPEAPPPLEPRETEMTFPFPYSPVGEDRGPGDDEYVQGVSHEVSFFGVFDHHIVWERQIDALAPEPGYELKTVNVTSVDRTNPDHGQPEADVRVRLPRTSPADHFTISLRTVNFHSQSEIKIGLTLGWGPTQDTLDARQAQYNAAQTQFKAETARAAYVAYVEAVRDRVRLAGLVQKRPSEDLRDEERTVVYRRLVQRLTGAEPDGTSEERHVTAELIRSLFDVDRMLYFVAPEWWVPRRKPARQDVTRDSGPTFRPADSGVTNGGSSGTEVPGHLAPSNRVSWGGTGAGRETYLVTEESAPAPLGASLGWILELDGDAHRNAFLNSPWVKAVIPIRPGREKAAIKWLRHAHVEGEDGLDQIVPGTNDTVEQALLKVADGLEAEADEAEREHAADRVFENGFDPLAGGTRVDATFPVFDAWIEVLPTDQIIAVDYQPDA